jgi:hypothetical protein
MATNDLSVLRPEALAKLGTLPANAQKALNALLRPERWLIAHGVDANAKPHLWDCNQTALHMTAEAGRSR